MAIITLPPSATNANQIYIVEGSAFGNTTTLITDGTDKINGLDLSITLPKQTRFLLYSNGVDGYTLIGYEYLSTGFGSNAITHNIDGSGLFVRLASRNIVATVVTGDTVSPDNLGLIDIVAIYRPAAAIAALTVSLAAPDVTLTETPTAEITVTQAVTALTFSGSVSSNGLPLSLTTSSGQGFRFIWISPFWYRIG